MSREIKFRAWNKINKELTSDPIIDGENGKMMAFSVLDAQFVRHYRDDEVEIMQYTGLKDNNGKEIYEGDVVDYLGDIELDNSNVLRVIEYKNEEACFVARLPVGVEGEEAVYLNEHDFKVIGNIYENPELLEESA